ncbi:MAG TPA: molybdopterin-guanine dinucleotide biosynthesis protein B [Planctomycetota bacterium]|nr:molybdopterin-guanine dinucleotide biosynthesis protein B [Planctomycetota bacterium]
MLARVPAFVVGFVGDSGVGKTTLLEGVIRALAARGRSVAAIKHSGGFDDPDPAGKDSARLRRAGARRVVLASRDRTVVFAEHPGAEPSFEDRLREAGDAEFVVVESYRSAGLAAIEVLRAALPRRVPQLGGHAGLLAVAADFEPQRLADSVPRLTLDPEAVARFLLDRARLRAPDPGS